jgi:hypothetical protein
MKQLLLVGVFFMLHTYNSYAQKNNNNCTFQESVQRVTVANAIDFEMQFPLNMKEAFISCHFGKANIGTVYFTNEMVTFSGKINAPVYCNVDSVRVKNIFKDEDVFCVFLEKGDYIIVFYNLHTCKVKQGQLLHTTDVLGTLAADEENNGKGLLELLLFKKKKIVNPEKYLKPKLSNEKITVVLTNV